MTTRALTHMLDCMPSAAHLLAQEGMLSLLNEKLLNIEYIDLAEQVISLLGHVAESQHTAMLRQGTLMAVLTFIDFFAMTVQRKIVNLAYNILKRIPNDAYTNVEAVLPNLTNLLSASDATRM